ncbi:MAG: hypothetical protein AB1668_06350 [Nanoarchaeota archaeon]
MEIKSYFGDVPADNLERLADEYNHSFKEFLPAMSEEEMRALAKQVICNSHTLISYTKEGVPVGCVSYGLVSPDLKIIEASLKLRFFDYEIRAEKNYNPNLQGASVFSPRRARDEIQKAEKELETAVRKLRESAPTFYYAGEGQGYALYHASKSIDFYPVFATSFVGGNFMKFFTIVSPGQRRKGVATQLNQRLEEELQLMEPGIKQVFTFTVTNKGMYFVNQKLGYEPILTVDRFYGDGSSMTLMGKQLRG